MRTLDLPQFARAARCPNMGDAEHGTAYLHYAGDICTRAFADFAAVPSGKPVGRPDEEEPFRVRSPVARESALRIRW